MIAGLFKTLKLEFPNSDFIALLDQTFIPQLLKSTAPAKSELGIDSETSPSFYLN